MDDVLNKTGQREIIGLGTVKDPGVLISGRYIRAVLGELVANGLTEYRLMRQVICMHRLKPVLPIFPRPPPPQLQLSYLQAPA